MNGLTMEILEGTYGVCRLNNTSAIPTWVSHSKFNSITLTEDELSIVCEMSHIPKDIVCEGDWKVLKVKGPLDFALTGILANISTILADSDISLFAISTYDTDYILVKNNDLDQSIEALTKHKHIIIV